MALPFLDTNVILRHLIQDSPRHSSRASALPQRIASGDTVVTTTDTVIFETVFTLQSFYRVPRPDIMDAVLALVALHAVRLAGKHRYRRVFELYTGYASLSFADCFHIATMEARGLTILISFDRGIDRIPTVSRIEPDSSGRIDVAPA